MPSVSLSDLSVAYNKGKTMALDSLDLEIKDGEFCVFLGPSGCGKTTALLCVAGLIEPTNGDVSIGDELVTSVAKKAWVRPQERNIAMVFQEYALYPNMKVRGNLSFALENMRMSKAEIAENVEKTAQMLGIEQFLDRRPAQLSGGQRQRVALGRALVRDPQVFLLDEPLGNLDQKLREQVRFELKRLQRRLEVTTIYVTHDQTEAMTLADRIVLMKDGKVIQQGSPRDLYMKPKNLFVAGFVGSPAINIFDGTIVKRDGNIVFQMKDFALPASPMMATWLGKTITMGIRPSDFTRAQPTDEYTIEAKVEVVEPLGDDVLLHAAIGGMMVTAKLDEGEQEGKEIALSVDPERIHMFDTVSGERVG